MSRAVSLIAALFLFAPAAAAEPFRYPEAKHGKGALTYVNGIPVLVLAGSPEEMGEQLAILGMKPAAGSVSVFKEVLKQHGLDRLTPLLRRFGDAMLAKYPDAYRREFEAMAKHSG